ncbi:MAG: serine/threonine protein kinase, partial [bacterium]
MATLKQIGDIQIFAEIYQGATTFVYKGFQPALDRFVFLKVLRPEFGQDENLSRSFEEEAKFIAKIQHPNVVTIFDYGRFEKWIYFAAEFIEGYNLSELLRFKKLPPELAYFILLESSKGLKAAHDKNILHKDIKPSNILISHDGQVKITDFGMADLRLTAKSEMEYEVKGTLAYFSPEQILGEQLNKYSDIFSLGATFYEMLTGAPAFSGNNTSEYFDSILN